MAAKRTRRYFKETRLQQLRGLCETARHGSLSRAADALDISRPSIWQQVRALEQQFGVSLVQCHGHKAELTDDGQLLLELATPLVDSFDSLKAAFDDRRQTLVRHLTVTTTPALLENELREPILEFHRQNPNVQLNLLDQLSHEGTSLLEAGAVDLGIFSHLDENP
jgi:molybdate transport repressor ModE-like protein